jgi:hypothetical protein
MISTEVTTPADDLLRRFDITDGVVFAAAVNPTEIVIDGTFDSCSADGKWSIQPVRITLKDPAGCDIAFQYPKDYGLVHTGDLGSFHEISATGPADAATFFLSYSYGAIRVNRCILTIDTLDWKAMEALHPWVLEDRLPLGHEEDRSE